MPTPSLSNLNTDLQVAKRIGGNPIAASTLAQPSEGSSAFGDAIVQCSNVIMLALDQARRFTAVNPAAERLFGRSSAELLGEPFSTVLDPYSHAKAALMLDQALETGAAVDWELDHIGLGGDPILVGYTVSAVPDDGFVAVGHDLTEKLELTHRLADANQQLEGALLQLEKAHTELKLTQAQLVQSEKMRALGQLVAGVAHEINNPAAFIANNLAFLDTIIPRLYSLFNLYSELKPLADPQLLPRLAVAEDAADIDHLWQDLPDLVTESRQGIERISEIISSLRNFARLDEAVMKYADVNAGLRSTVQIARTLHHAKVEFIESYGQLPILLCQPGQLNQVFLNLLTNAVDAISTTGKVWISSMCDGEKIVVTIRDTGSGMSVQTLSRLGEPFFTTKPVGSGMGLGLAISFGIINSHHGRLYFQSEPGTGAVAIVELPVTLGGHQGNQPI